MAEATISIPLVPTRINTTPVTLRQISKPCGVYCRIQVIFTSLNAGAFFVKRMSGSGEGAVKKRGGSKTSYLNALLPRCILINAHHP
jgi:hypothetical protein